MAVDLGGGQNAGDDVAHVAPDLHGVVLDPPGAREDLLVLLLLDRDDLAVVIEQDGAGGGRALVDGQDVPLVVVLGVLLALAGVLLGHEESFRVVADCGASPGDGAGECG